MYKYKYTAAWTLGTNLLLVGYSLPVQCRLFPCSQCVFRPASVIPIRCKPRKENERQKRAAYVASCIAHGAAPPSLDLLLGRRLRTYMAGIYALFRPHVRVHAHAPRVILGFLSFPSLLCQHLAADITFTSRRHIDLRPIRCSTESLCTPAFLRCLRWRPNYQNIYQALLSSPELPSMSMHAFALVRTHLVRALLSPAGCAGSRTYAGYALAAC